MGGGKSSTSTQTVSIPPDVLARYNAVNARAEQAAQTPFQAYGGEFVAPLTPTQQAGIQATSDYSQSAQPYFGAATGLTMAGARGVGPLTQGQIGYYQDPAMLATLAPTAAALQQQQGQQLAQQQSEAIRAGAFGGERAGLQRAQLLGQQQLGMGQALAPIYQQAYQTGLQTAQQQQNVIAQDQARRLQAGQQLAGLGTGAQAAALQGAQAQIGAGTLQQQTQQAQDTAQYQQFLQERGYPFQVAQFLANIAEGTGALSGSTTTTTQPRGFFSNRGGFKTGEGSQRSEKAYGGGLVPSSMGGVVSEPGAFERGGYATAGAVVDPTDLSAILQQQKQAFGPFAAAGPYGQSQFGAPHGGSGIVPQQQMHVPKLMTAGALPKQTPGTFSDLSKGYQSLNQIADDMTGKSLTRRFGEKTGLAPGDKTPEPGASPDATQAYKPQDTIDPSNAPTPMARPSDADLAASSSSSSGGFGDFLSGLNPFKADGGGVMPRQHFEGGGPSVNPYAQRDPSEGYIDDTIQEEDKTKTPDMLKPGGGTGGGGGGLGGDLMKGAQLFGAAKGLASAGSWLADTLPAIIALKDGGVVSRQHFAGGGPPQSSPEPFNYSNEQLEEFARNALPGIGAAESGAERNPYAAQNPNSTASGKFQFTDDTGRDVLKKHPEIFKGVDFDPSQKRWVRTLPDTVQDAMGFAHAKDQARLLASRGIEPTPLNIYINHFLGEAGGPNFLSRMKADPNAPAHSLVTPAAYQNNQSIFFDPDGNARTAQQVYDIMGSRMSGKGIGKAQQYASAQPTTMTDGTSAGFFDRNKGIILPVLQGLGAMASSKSISPWAAALQGLGAGAKAYGDVEAQQAGIESTQAQTQAVLANITKGAAIYGPSGQLTGYRVYINGRVTTVTPMEFLRALRAGTPYQTAPQIGQTGGIPSPAPSAAQPKPGQTTVGGQPSSTTTPVVSAPYETLSAGDKSLVEQNAEAAMTSNPAALGKDASAYTQASSDAQNAIVSRRDTLNYAKSLSELPTKGLVSANEWSAKLATPAVSYINGLIHSLGGDFEIVSPKDLANVEIIRKMEGLRANAQTTAAGQHSFSALQQALTTVPTQSNTPGGAANLVADMLMREQLPADYYRHLDLQRRYALEKGLVTGEDQAKLLGTGTFKNFMDQYSGQQMREKAALRDIFLTPLDYKDANGATQHTSLMSYLISTNGQPPAELRAKIEKQYGPQIFRYFSTAARSQ